MSEAFQFFAGIDAGWKDLHASVMDPSGREIGHRIFRYNGDDLGRLVDWLLETCRAEPFEIAVAIEVPRGAVVETLLERGVCVFSLNPKQLDRFRDRHTVAGAKDDRRDAFVLADSLRTDRKCFKALKNDDPEIIELRGLVRMDQELRDEVTRLSNQLTEQLRRFFPQFLEFGSLATQPWLWDLLELVPTPDHSHKVRPKEIQELLDAHGIRRLTARAVSKTLRRKPLVLAPGVVQAVSLHVGSLIPRLRLAYSQRADCKKRLEKAVKDLAAPIEEGAKSQHRDAAIILSFPGQGIRTTAAMLAEAHGLLEERALHALRCYGGIAPVSKQSGKQARVTMRRSCSNGLQQALYHWANVARQHDAATKAHYDRLKGRGHSHARAVRSVADRLLRHLCGTLKSRTLYDRSICDGNVPVEA